jgi:alkylation response protein AidB-like acyl-CoA dehydrogenase
MSTDLDELHDELRAVARDALGDGGRAPDQRLLAELGWLGLEVPESLGGSGATFAEVAVVVEEMGRAASATAFFGSVVLGVGALDLIDPNAARDELLRAVAAGETRVTVALDADRNEALPFRLDRSGSGTSVRGFAAYVLDATDADVLLLPAADPEGHAVMVRAPVGGPGLTIDAQPLLDDTRRVATVTAAIDDVAADAVWPLRGDPTALLDRAAVALALDALGLSEAMLDATVAYAKDRQQFGRPIGSFQAVKHACADMAVACALSRELVTAAVRSLVDDPDGSSAAASRAKSFATEAAVDVAGSAMQLHGGIGYTWESGVHTYLKRAALDRALFGSPRWHRRRLVETAVLG